MDSKTIGVIESVGGLEQFEQLVERGRQLHNQAVFEMFARLVSNVMQALKNCYDITIGKQANRRVYLKQT